MTTILVLHGPNLNLLGSREPNIYGHTTLDEINTKLKASSRHTIDCFQSNAEHELIDKIHQARENDTAIMIFNPAAFTHTSIALRDAILACNIPFIEVHLSNPDTREAFRKTSYFSDIALTVFKGKGLNSYLEALAHAEQYLINHRG